MDKIKNNNNLLEKIKNTNRLYIIDHKGFIWKQEGGRPSVRMEKILDLILKVT